MIYLLVINIGFLLGLIVLIYNMTAIIVFINFSLVKIKGKYINQDQMK